MPVGRGDGVKSVGWGGGKNIFLACRALHHPYPRAFCTLPSFARIKRPRWRPVGLNDRHLRSNGKIGDCEQSIFYHWIGQFQSTWACFGEDKTVRPRVNKSTSFRHVDISPCLWLQLVTELPVGIWIRDIFKLKIDRSVRTPWQEYGVTSCRLLVMGSSDQGNSYE